MDNIKLTDQTREIGKPSNWNEEVHGTCISISVHDRHTSIGNFMVTGWKPTCGELEVLNQDGHIWLEINGEIHPVIKIYAA